MTRLTPEIAYGYVLSNRKTGRICLVTVKLGIEESQLLRRQIARRCIYGVDINPLATELARLSVWIHTFVPGLPLTFLNHNLVTGDSLAGIAGWDEVREVIDATTDGIQESVFSKSGGSQVGQWQGLLDKMGKMADADAKEVREAAEMQQQIEQELHSSKCFLDVVAASRVDENIDAKSFVATVFASSLDRIESLPEYKRAQQLWTDITPLHFPIAFPEVFTDERNGFDVILGNPPWEEATLEIDEFWMRYSPNLQGKTQTQKERIIAELERERPDLQRLYELEVSKQAKQRAVLSNGPYPGMGTGDPDYYKAFSWRFWHLTKPKGHIGVVVPRSLFASAGSAEIRRTMLEEGSFEDITFLLNRKQWIFDISSQYEPFSLS